MRKLLGVCRLSEWNDDLKFEAVKLIPREDAELMLKNRDGEELPTQWIEVDKNDIKRTEQADIPPRMKSRFAAQGGLS